MRPSKPILLLLALLSALPAAHAKDKKRPDVPVAFNEARTIYVEARAGQQFDRNLDPEDREAIANVQDVLQAWNRYKLVTQREDADIVIVVQRGHTEGRDRGATPGDASTRNIDPSGTQNGPMNRGMDPSGAGFPEQHSSGPEFPADIDSNASQDLFEVCQVNANGKLTRPLWSRSLEGGLSGPHVMLFQEFKDAVEKAYPSPPPGKSASQQNPE
jgi:hypothetical protein